MPRRARPAFDNVPCHVINRAVRSELLFGGPHDYEEFQGLLVDALKRQPAQLVAYCLMPSHWHLVIWPQTGAALSRLLHWLTSTHARRWHAARGVIGTGPLYRNRFKAIPIRSEQQLLTVCRYVERNALRANLASRAEGWPWSSAWQRVNNCSIVPLSDVQPLHFPDWIDWLNRPQTEAELAAWGRVR